MKILLDVDIGETNGHLPSICFLLLSLSKAAKALMCIAPLSIAVNFSISFGRWERILTEREPTSFYHFLLKNLPSYPRENETAREVLAHAVISLTPITYKCLAHASVPLEVESLTY